MFILGKTTVNPRDMGTFLGMSYFFALKEINYTEMIVMEPFLLPRGQVARDIRGMAKYRKKV